MPLIRRLTFIFLLILPWILAAAWSSLPALRALAATRDATLPTMSDQDWDDSQQTMSLRRGLQKHFLSHDVYIPMEDIVVTAPSENADGAAEDLGMLMQKACGRGRLYVWIPLKWRIPVLGEKVLEWCWKPMAPTSKSAA